MKKIIVVYFFSTKFHDLPWDEKAEFNFTTRKRNEIINKCLNLGYQVMIFNNTDGNEIIAIDNKRFRQR